MSKLKQNDLDTAFSIYLTDSLYYSGKGMRINQRFIELVNPEPEEEIDADAIVLDIIRKGGLKF